MVHCSYQVRFSVELIVSAFLFFSPDDHTFNDNFACSFTYSDTVPFSIWTQIVIVT